MKNKKNKKIIGIILVIALALAVIFAFIYYTQPTPKNQLQYGESCGASIDGCCATGLDCYDSPNDNSDVVGLCAEEGILFAPKLTEGDKCE